MLTEAQTIIFVGEVGTGRDTTSGQRMHSLAAMGYKIVEINSSKKNTSFLEKNISRVQKRIFNHIGNPSLKDKLNDVVSNIKADILWIEKGLTVSPETLILARQLQNNLKIVGFSPDDMMNKSNQSNYFIEGLPHYDVYFTTKSYGVDELKSLGCKNVQFVQNSYDDVLHRPLALTKAEKQALGGAVGFVGTAERERAESVKYLSNNTQGASVKVWGDHWDKWKRRIEGRFDVKGPSQYGEQYVKILCSFEINLCFLRKCNRDLQTTRSIEIPACGAFMLAERTDEHLALFEEGKEAEFFGSNEELLDKAKYYIKNASKRIAIAEAGRARCLSSGYSYTERLKEMLKKVNAF